MATNHRGQPINENHTPYPRIYAALVRDLRSSHAKAIVESLHASKQNLRAGSPDSDLLHPREWQEHIREILSPNGHREHEVPEDAHLQDAWESRYEGYDN